MKNKPLIFLMLVTFFCACSTPSYVVKVKKTDFSFNSDTEEEIPVVINVLVGDGIDMPQQPVVNYQLSYSITNQSKTKTWLGYIDTKDGQRKNAFLSVQIQLSDGTIVENRANLIFLNQVSPQITSSYQYLPIQIARGKTIIGIHSAKVTYESQNIPSLKVTQ